MEVPRWANEILVFGFNVKYLAILYSINICLQTGIVPGVVDWFAEEDVTCIHCQLGFIHECQERNMVDIVNPLTTDDQCTRHATLAARYQLV